MEKCKHPNQLELIFAEQYVSFHCSYIVREKERSDHKTMSLVGQQRCRFKCNRIRCVSVCTNIQCVQSVDNHNPASELCDSAQRSPTIVSPQRIVYPTDVGSENWQFDSDEIARTTHSKMKRSLFTRAFESRTNVKSIRNVDVGGGITNTSFANRAKQIPRSPQ